MTRGYLEHVAIRVQSLTPHLAFFRDVFGMEVRDEKMIGGLRQVWVTGGIQFIEDPDFIGPEGRFAHLGIFVEDLDAALDAALSHDVTVLPKGRNWLLLPDGLEVELDQAQGDAVARALAVDARNG
ncbi:Glyoxalase/Bleomycin resistance protein/Dioxygenase superfamily protein [Mameliella alba]|uniref:VOC family protein n=1 Tax=Mameliella alba TaxID=561184 RepID=UPI00088D7656|nr:VOC family protein [Mameliella alba]OWV46506.1 glyoxalase [Mameliella alba]PTR37320.1 glyoxalase/bleomycin resistance protein/dioxygenase superfamily protein [Mameliella alba]GGF73816.1 glyoxalase [Mameliella alba]SDD75728.1 Glyoxalase/Bleomycin resistance protein/Dioxygenase superfamily protein [Mameliella alba]